MVRSAPLFRELCPEQANRKRLAAFIFAVLLAACAGNGHHEPASGSTAQTKRQPEKVIVTDAKGMTVYIHDTDSPLKSRCYGGCLNSWLPVRPTPDFPLGGKFVVIARTDGSPQLAYNGRPLYTFVNDKQPGDKKGDGKEGKWHALYY
jgi:predicted lipoprotein with Yx(FWY)xxD motif